MRAEANSNSPFWKVFYETSLKDRDEEEIIPETPVTSGPIMTVQYNPSSPQGESSRIQMDRGKRKISEEENINFQPTMTMKEEISSDNDTQLQIELPSTMRIDPLPQKKQRKPAVKDNKKGRRFSPYEQQASRSQKLDDTHLLDTPIQFAGESGEWALVASPKKPLGDK